MAESALDIERVRMTTISEINAKLGKMIKPGMSIMITKDTNNHRIPIGTSCEIVKANRPGRYNNDYSYSVKDLTTGTTYGTTVPKGNFKLIGIQRSTVNEILAALDKERSVYQSLLEAMDGYGLTNDTDYVDVRKELVKQVYTSLQDEGVDEATRLTKVVELIDTLSLV
jgi:hypothetical protein